MHAEQEGEGEAKGSRAIWLEQQYRERMDTILESMQEGPLFQVTFPCSNGNVYMRELLLL